MPVIIYGNGPIAKLAWSYAKHSMTIAGFTVDDVCVASDRFCGLPLIKFSDVENIFSPQDYEMLIAVGFARMNGLRVQRYQDAKAKGYAFTRYIHPSVMMHDDTRIEENSIILDHVSVHPGCRIGSSSFISSNVNIGHDCVLGSGCWVNAGVSIAGGSRLGAQCFLGVNAAISHGICVAAENFIGANTLVNKNTDAKGVYISEPGIKFRLNSQAFLTFSEGFSDG